MPISISLPARRPKKYATFTLWHIRGGQISFCRVIEPIKIRRKEQTPSVDPICGCYIICILLLINFATGERKSCQSAISENSSGNGKHRAESKAMCICLVAAHKQNLSHKRTGLCLHTGLNVLRFDRLPTHYAYATWAYLHWLIFAGRISRQVVSATACLQWHPHNNFPRQICRCHPSKVVAAVDVAAVLRYVAAVSPPSVRIECTALKCSINSARQTAKCKLATGNCHWKLQLNTAKAAHLTRKSQIAANTFDCLWGVLIYCLYVMQFKGTKARWTYTEQTES